MQKPVEGPEWCPGSIGWRQESCTCEAGWEAHHGYNKVHAEIYIPSPYQEHESIDLWHEPLAYDQLKVREGIPGRHDDENHDACWGTAWRLYCCMWGRDVPVHATHIHGFMHLFIILTCICDTPEGPCHDLITRMMYPVMWVSML